MDVIITAKVLIFCVVLCINFVRLHKTFANSHKNSVIRDPLCPSLTQDIARAGEYLYRVTRPVAEKVSGKPQPQS